MTTKLAVVYFDHSETHACFCLRWGDPRTRRNGDLAGVAVLLNFSDHPLEVTMGKILAQHEKADCVHSQSQSQSQSTVELSSGYTTQPSGLVHYRRYAHTECDLQVAIDSQRKRQVH